MKAAKIRPSVFTKDTSESDQHAPTDPIKPRKACQEQQKDITVELIDEFQEVLDELIGHVKPLLIRLQDNGVIPPTKTVSSLNPDYTRFVLKQAQMSTRERDENSKEMQIYCITVCLHALVSSVDILMQSGLEASIGKYKLVRKHSFILGLYSVFLSERRKQVNKMSYTEQDDYNRHYARCRLRLITSSMMTLALKPYLQQTK